jgi:cyclic beta-1,2-glucan synthetase
VTAHYVRITDDVSILDEPVPFLTAPLLEEGQHEIYIVPKVAEESATLLEHCRRAIQKSSATGSHHLPLMGSGDWNDGMNRVGIEGKGESVWLAWFLIHVMNDFSDLLTFSGQENSGEHFKSEAKRLAQAVEETAWDGSWYRRAYFDNGTPLGSNENSECKIDSLAQSWAVICGLGDPNRTPIALDSAYKELVDEKNNVVKLLTPPFDTSEPDPGYIRGYPPGVRENGGQYTHGSSWLAMAYARMGDGDKAVSLLNMMHPTCHTTNMESVFKYRVEPYVICADVYDLEGQIGRGGWTWYSGSSGWIYRIWLEEILGFKLRGNKLTIECTIPTHWNGFKLNYQHKTSHYLISVENPHHICRGRTSVTVDGNLQSSPEILLVDDGQQHTVNIVLEK